MLELKEILQLLNVLVIPVLVYVVLIERRLTRIETVCQLRNEKGSSCHDG